MNKHFRSLAALSFVLIFTNLASVMAQSNDATDYFRALRLMGKEQYDEALEILKTIQNGEYGCRAVEKTVEIYKAKNDLKSADSHFKNLLVKDSTSVIGFYGLAQVAFEQKEFDRAVSLLKQTIALGAQYHYPYAFLYKCYSSGGGKTEEMMSYFKQLIARDSTNALYFLCLARAYVGIDSMDRALRLLDKTLFITLAPEISLKHWNTMRNLFGIVLSLACVWTRDVRWAISSAFMLSWEISEH